MYNFNGLKVYRRAEVFADEVHRVTMKFPKFELYGLGDQMRRAVDSVVSNIAEGGGKETDAEILLFLRHAVGSCNELESQIGRACRKGYVSDNDNERLGGEVVEIRKMLLGFMRRFR